MLHKVIKIIVCLVKPSTETITFSRKITFCDSKKSFLYALIKVITNDQVKTLYLTIILQKL
jgi:hypothetical protein